MSDNKTNGSPGTTNTEALVTRMKALANEMVDLACRLEGVDPETIKIPQRVNGRRVDHLRVLKPKGDAHSDAIRARSRAAAQERTEDIKRRLKLLLDAQTPYAQLAPALGIAHSTMRQYLNVIGRGDLIPVAGRRLSYVKKQKQTQTFAKDPSPRIPDDQLRALVDQGNTNAAIMKATGVTKKWLEQACKRLGLPKSHMRSPLMRSVNAVTATSAPAASS